MTVLAAVDAFRRASGSGATFVEADVGAFRAAMRQLASGVCLVTHSVGGERAGMTATAVASLSLDPPTLIVCVNRAASTYAGLAPRRRFRRQRAWRRSSRVRRALCRSNGEEGAERFREGRWRIAPNGAPLLWDALAAFACEVDDIVERNTHAIVIGRVKHAAAASAAARSSTGAAATISSAGATTSWRALPAFRRKARDAGTMRGSSPRSRQAHWYPSAARGTR